MGLEHIRILDLGQIFSAPYASMLIGAMGADVIKIEPPSGEDGRDFLGPPYWGEDSTFFLAGNWYKRSLVLDLKTAEGRGVLRELVKSADVLVHNYRPAVVEKFELSYAALAELNPRLVYCQITGFGADGPYAGRPGLDSVFQAMAGMNSVNGEPDRPPVKVGNPVIDVSTGIYAAVGILGALVERAQTGRGQQVDLAMLDVTMALQNPLFTYYFATGKIPERMANDSHIAVSNTFATRDGLLSMSLFSQRFWEKFCAATQRADLAADARFSTVRARMENKQALYALLNPMFAQHDTAHWVELLVSQGIPCSPVNRYDQVMANPQVQHNALVIESVHPEVGAIRGLDAPQRLTSGARRTPVPPPVLGQHTREILAEAGYDEVAIAKLHAQGVTAPRRLPKRG